MKKVIVFFMIVLISLPCFVFAEYYNNSLKGKKMYVRTNLKIQGSLIYFHNMQGGSGHIINAGTLVTIVSVIGKYIKFEIDGKKEKKSYRIQTLPVHFIKYFVKDKNEIGLNDISEDVKKKIKEMKVEEGMTKNEVYISRGCPSFIGYSLRSFEYNFDAIMQSNEWYYNFNKRRKSMVVKFKDDKVYEIERWL